MFPSGVFGKSAEYPFLHGPFTCLPVSFICSDSIDGYSLMSSGQQVKGPYRLLSCQKATALAAATFRESTP